MTKNSDIPFLSIVIINWQNEVLDKWSKSEFLKGTSSVEARGWLLDVLLCVERLNKEEFTLNEVYDFEGYLQAKHPSNHRVKEKIRQQLQVLRDRNIIEFLGRGHYHLRSTGK